VEKKKKNRAGRMGFSSIQKTASTGSSATGALVGANSLQPTIWASFSLYHIQPGLLFFFFSQFFFFQNYGIFFNFFRIYSKEKKIANLFVITVQNFVERICTP
jgi:hypothetical protein